MSATDTTSLATPESYDPFAGLDRWFDAVADQLDAGFGVAPARSTPGAPKPLRAPRTDVRDLGAAYRIVAELPGIPKEKLFVRVRGTTVELRAEVDAASAEERSTYLLRERHQLGFLRTIELPEPVVGGKARATLKDGVLTLELPKEHPEPTPPVVQVPVQ